jgi:hypothetical protein
MKLPCPLQSPEYCRLPGRLRQPFDDGRAARCNVNAQRAVSEKNDSRD